MNDIKHRLTPKMSIAKAAPVDDRLGFLICKTSKILEDHSLLCTYNSGSLQGFVVPSSCQSIKVLKNNVYFLSEDGFIWKVNKSNFEYSDPIVIEDEAGSTLRDFAIFEEREFMVVGSLNMVFTAGPSLDDWRVEEVCVDQEVDLDNLEDSIYGFESLAGFSDDEVYAVGWGGSICFWNGKNWRKIESPTNVDLFSVVCATNGSCYICGSEGVVLKGRFEQWEVIENEFTSEDLWSVCEFKGEIYIADGFNVYGVSKNRLESTDFDVENAEFQRVHLLSCCENYLWAIGEQSIIQFDGQSWQTIYVGNFEG